MINLYYAIEIELTSFNEAQETTGYKWVTVYEINTNTPRVFAELYFPLEDSTENEIKEWLEENDYNVNNFKLNKL